MFKKQGLVTVCLVILTALLITGCTTTPVAVTGVTLNQAAMTLTAGGATGTLVATVVPADTTDQSVSWSSSVLAVATIADGVVTPLTAGTTIITVTTVDGGLTATCAVTVNSPVAVGDSYGGGIVAYILQSGDTGYDANVQHGLISAIDDVAITMLWSNITDSEIGSTGTAIGTGQANTTAIVNQIFGGEPFVQAELHTTVTLW